LAGIGMRKFSELQVHDDEASKPAVEENQIDPIPFGSYAQALLAGDESKGKEGPSQIKQAHRLEVAYRKSAARS
jgi:hypothetical protein